MKKVICDHAGKQMCVADCTHRHPHEENISCTNGVCPEYPESKCVEIKP